MTDIYDRYEIDGRIFEAVYPGRCTIDSEHKIKRGDRVAKLTRKDNPMLPVPGVACKLCTDEIRYG